MDFQTALEILHVFKSSILAENHIKKITEFGIPYEISDGICNKYIKAEFYIGTTGNVYEYKSHSGETWLRFHYYSNDELQSIEQYINDKKLGKCWNKIENPEGQYDIYQTDENGNKVYSSRYLNGKLKMNKVVETGGKVITHNEFKNEIVTRSITYSQTNKIISDFRFDTIGNSTTKREYEYDERDNQIRFLYTAKSGEITTDLRMTYDANNNLIESVDIPKPYYSELYNVDLDKLAEEGDDTESYRHTYAYNINNLLIEHKIFLARQYCIAYRYEYFIED